MTPYCEHHITYRWYSSLEPDVLGSGEKLAGASQSEERDGARTSQRI
jgi:hypothetical protein